MKDYPTVYYNERFSFTRDIFQWILMDWPHSRVNEKGGPKEPSFTYYPRMEFMISVMQRRTQDDCTDMQQLEGFMQEARDACLQHCRLLTGGAGLDLGKGGLTAAEAYNRKKDLLAEIDVMDAIMKESREKALAG